MAPAGVGGPIVVVCGLHGGAGTTTIATTLAAHAARVAGPGSVMLTETDPSGGGIALALDAASPHTLAELAALRAAGATPARTPFAQLLDGTRLVAAAPAERDAADPDDVAAMLQEAGAAHAMTIVDAGTIREPHRFGGLQAATALIWTASASAPIGMLHRLATGPLARSAQHLPWLLAVTDTTGSTDRDPLGELRRAVPETRIVVLVPRLAGTPLDHPRRDDVARDLIDGLQT